MPRPSPLRGLAAVMDRALNPHTATRNAGMAAVSLSDQIRERERIDRALDVQVTGPRADRAPH